MTKEKKCHQISTHMQEGIFSLNPIKLIHWHSSPSLPLILRKRICEWQLSARGIGESQKGEHNRLPGNGVGEDSDSSDAAEVICTPPSQAISFHWRVSGSYSCFGVSASRRRADAQ